MAYPLRVAENPTPAAMHWAASAFFKAAAAADNSFKRKLAAASSDADRAAAAETDGEPVPSIIELSDDDRFSEPFYAIILVNQPLVAGFRNLWRRASVRICADGGANRLFDGLQESERSRLLPSFIKGDLDSIRGDVAQYYRDQNVPIILDPDQDSTDLMKCMDELEAWERRTNAATHPVLICGALTGRFDHMMHAVHFLHQHSQSQRQILLVSDDSIAYLLDRGQHRISVDFGFEGPTCGLMPCAGPAVISTHGLQWNLVYPYSRYFLERAMCSFGGLLSTSNALAETEVLVETDAPVIWTVERNPSAL